MGHTDVVPAEADRWMHDPFGGEIHGGFLWGRGAVDMKNIDAIHLTVARALKRAGQTLPRDLLLAFTADEEAGSTYGMEWVAQNHFEWVDAEYALSEGDGEEMLVGGRSFYGVQTGEKGGFRFRCAPAAGRATARCRTTIIASSSSAGRWTGSARPACRCTSRQRCVAS